MHLAGECVFHTYVGTHGHKGIFAVRSGAVVKNEVGCGGIEHGCILDRTSTYGHSCKREPASCRVYEIHKKASPAYALVAVILPVIQVGHKSLTTHTQPVPEMHLCRSSDSERYTAHTHRPDYSPGR